MIRRARRPTIAGMPSPDDTAIGRPGLHGRDEEVRWLNAALATAGRGAGALLLVEGAAGTGKSRLVQEARVRARARGARVLATRPLDGDDGPGVLGRLCEAAGAERDASALVRALSRLAGDGPVVVAVDDVDRCDRGSLHALAALALAVEHLGAVALVLARRHHAPACADAATLDALFGDPGAVRIRLGALDAGAIAAIVADVLDGAAAGEFVAATLELTGGNAFLVTELALAARERGIEPTADAVTALGELALPAVARAVSARVAPLGDGAPELLAALGVLGDDATTAAAAALTQRDRERVADLCVAFVAADVLAPGDPPRFAQPLLSPAVLGSVPPRERRRLHGAAARVLSGESAAAHLLASSPTVDAWAAMTLRDAARSAPAEQAAAYLQRALAEGVPELEGELSRALGEAAAAGGDATARAHLERALELAEAPRERAEIGLALVRVLIAMDADDAAAAACDAALRELGDGDSGLRLRLRAEHPACVDAVASAEDSADRARRALRGGSLFDEEGSLVAHRALDALTAADCLDEAAALCDVAIARAQGRGATFAAAAALARRAAVRLRLGDLQGAVADARAVLAAAPFGASAAVCAPAVEAMIDALIEVDDLDGALALVDAAPPLARARVHLAHGHHAAALYVVDAAPTGSWRTPATAPWRSVAAECHLGLGDHARARSLAIEEVALARDFGAPVALARALRALARTGDAVAHCRDAVAVLDGSGALLERAHALVDFGSALRAGGHRREARDALRDGMQLAHRCGAMRLAARARDELVAAGGRPRRPAHRGVDGLTRGERRVAELAAAGLSNREIGGELFVTINTVCAHLASVYRKLGISSRAQLPVLLGEAA